MILANFSRNKGFRAFGDAQPEPVESTFCSPEIS